VVEAALADLKFGGYDGYPNFGIAKSGNLPNLVCWMKNALSLSMFQTQRELLDAELDLMARQQEGGDTAELKKKVALLKMEAARAASLQARATLRASRGALRARGRAISRGLRAATSALFRGG